MERTAGLQQKWFVHSVRMAPNNNDSTFPLHTNVASELNQSYRKLQNTLNGDTLCLKANVFIPILNDHT